MPRELFIAEDGSYLLAESGEPLITEASAPVTSGMSPLIDGPSGRVVPD